MSKVSISGDQNGTGNFTIKAPNSNTDRTLTLPDEAGSVLTDASDIEPQVKTATNASGDAPVYACRAWVHFSQFDLNIRNSGNVSSITDNGTGKSTVNFTISMPDNNYSVSFGGAMRGNGSDRNAIHQVDNNSAAGVDDFNNNTKHDVNGVAVNNKQSNGTLSDSDHFTVMIFR